MLVNVDRLHTVMEEERLDGVVASTLANVRYFADFDSLALAGFPYEAQCYVVFTRDSVTEPTVITSSVEIDQMLDGQARDAIRFGTFYREDPVGELELTAEEEWLRSTAMKAEAEAGPLEGLSATFAKLGLKKGRVGIDEIGLLPGYLEEIRGRSPDVTFVEASTQLRWVRKVKTAEEIRRLRRSARMTEQGIRSAAAIARQGVTEVELAREFERSIVSQGGRPQFTLIRIGRNAVAGQREQDHTPLRKGDLIWFDAGAKVDGYWSDVARTYLYGEPTARVKTLYAALLKGEQEGIARTEPGMTGQELFGITMEAARQHGHPDYRRHHVGHGIGAEVYEPPILRPGSQDTIEEGAVINIETPYYEFGLGALHVEDPYVVRADGDHELLTTLGRQLHILPAE